MNKRINTHLALIVILLLAIGVTAYTLLKSSAFENEIDYNPKNQNLIKIKPDSEKQTQNQNSCQVRAYEGSAEVRVWQVEENEKLVLRVSPEDISKIPPKSDADFQLIDPTPELEQEITLSSEKNPVKIKISGFASLCDGTYLASLEYKEGIFRPYIK